MIFLSIFTELSNCLLS